MIEVLNPLTMSDWMRLQVTQSRKVGNALKGAGFISTTDTGNTIKYACRLCQCPERGDLHFHSNVHEKNYLTENCVNALKGATFISTVPQ